jgi:hypothetical protein
MQRGDMLVIAMGLIACVALLYAIDWARLYDNLLWSVHAQIYGR